MRNIIAQIKDIFLNFLFEKSEKLISLEALPLSAWQEWRQPLFEEDTFCIFSYKQSEVKDAIWEIKYKRNTKLLSMLGTIAADTLGSYLEDKIGFETLDQFFIIPIPSHKERFKEKGFNQAEDIARFIAKSLPFSPTLKTNILIKIINTKDQVKLKREERLLNMTNSFNVPNPHDVKGKTIILVDDVLTTGATFKEAKKTLLEAGARKIYCLVLAHG